MQAQSGNESINFGSRLTELGIVLPASPTPLGAYVESSDTRNLLFLSGTLPVVNGKLAIAGRLGENLSIKEGQDAARIASLNALAAAKEHLGDINQLKKLIKLTVVMATTAPFVEHAAVADGASNLFAQLFGRETGHVRLVYGVQSLPIGAPVIVDTIFEIEPVGPLSPQNAKKTDRNYLKATRGAALALQLALAAGFLSAIADRLGLWGKPGTPGVA